MREIITLAAGQAGNTISLAFWDMLLKEHSLDESGKRLPDASPDVQHGIPVFFREGEKGKEVPRSVNIDLEPSVLDTIRSSKLGGLFRPSNIIHGQSGAGNNFAKGYYTEGAELVDEVMDSLRQEAEACDLLQGFNVLHSLGGGTGSGLGCLVLSKLREEYPDRILLSNPVLPAPRVSEAVVEPYNATLSFHQLVESTDICSLVDNEALYDIWERQMKQKSPSFANLNTLVANVLSGLTTTLRFPGQLNADLRKLSVNLVPFPRLHFLSTAFAPVLAEGSAQFQKFTIADLTSQAFSPDAQMAALDPRHGKYLTVAAIYRGSNVSSRDVEETLQSVHNKNASHFVDWIPNSALSSLCLVPPLQTPLSVTLIGNTTAIQELFKRTHEQFNALFRRKAFLHWYTGEGMEEMEFAEASSNLLDLCEEYQQYQEGGVGEDEEFDGSEFDHQDEAVTPTYEATSPL